MSEQQLVLMRMPLGPLGTNCYVIGDKAVGEAFIIDPATPEVLDALKKHDLKPKAILLTHGHGDHIGGVQDIVDAYQVPVYIHKGDVPYLADPELNLSAYSNPTPIKVNADIIGYITRGRGVSIHRSDCTSLGHTPEDLERMIEVSWDGSSGESFHVGIDIQAYDRNGLLMEVMAVLSELKITITNINAKVQEDTKTVSINVVVDIRDISQLDFVMTKLRRIREVYTVQRSKGEA